MAGTREDRGFLMPFVSHNSSKSLAIPLGLNEYFPDPLPLTVELKVYGGRSWTIRMKKRGEEEQVFLTLGWENFVRENNVEDGKFLNFFYDCCRTFLVIIFGHDRCSEFIDFPQVVIDVGDYETKEEEEEEDKNMMI